MFPRLPAVYRTLSILLILAVLFFTLLVQWSTRSADKLQSFPPWTEKSSSDSDKSQSKIIQGLGTTSRTKLIARTSQSGKSSFLASVNAASTTSSSEVNPHSFNYTLNPKDVCTGHTVYLVVYIHTAPANFRKRQMIRHTWGSQKLLRKYDSKLVFVMGQVEIKSLMDKVYMESEHYGDIVQESFIDTYRNLTYKGIAALEWVSNYCPNAVYALKTDDDILVNIVQLMNVMKGEIEKTHGKTNLILCNQWTRMKVLRDKKSKWYIPPEVFPLDYFPPYCSGSAFIFSVDVVKRMNAVSSSVPFFWVDDYYITGMLAAKINVKQKRLNDAYILNGKVVVDRLKNDTNNKLLFFHVSKLNSIYSMWNIVRERMKVPKDEDEFLWTKQR